MNQLSKYPHLNRYVSNLKSIPGGTYRFGFSKDQTRAAPRITISSFRMGATPVTWGMWKEYCKAESVRSEYGPHLPEDSGWGYPDNHPVVNVSWEDIMYRYPGGFCKWASGVAGFKLTLPTDAQWEYAARGGKDGLEYPWGNNFDKSKTWCGNDADKTAAVDRTDRIYRNGYGLTDMVGNVWQWCADYYNGDYRPAGKDPVDTHKSKYRCVRGTAWLNNDSGFGFLRCANRGMVDPDGSSYVNGFRLSAGQK